MRKRVVLTVVLWAGLLAPSARGQTAAGPTADEQAVQADMQQTALTVMANMRAKGIDPRQLFEQLQNGTDPADIAKQLVAQGVIDQSTVDRLQGNMQRMATGRIRDRLNVTDAEWTALQPLLQRVIAAQTAVQMGGGNMMRMGSMGGLMAPRSPLANEVAAALRELRAALHDPAPAPGRVAAALAAYRDAHARARQELAAARDALAGVLVVRQEAVLASLGLLE